MPSLSVSGIRTIFENPVRLPSLGVHRYPMSRKKYVCMHFPSIARLAFLLFPQQPAVGKEGKLWKKQYLYPPAVPIPNLSRYQSNEPFLLPSPANSHRPTLRTCMHASSSSKTREKPQPLILHLYAPSSPSSSSSSPPVNSTMTVPFLKPASAIVTSNFSIRLVPIQISSKSFASWPSKGEALSHS